ncbi:unnamed protein product [Closterium sp. Yama58-4]|nr:unnamed protein product [Closterium sp. Yama58-4]
MIEHSGLELRARRPVNEDDPSKKLPEVQTPPSEHATRSKIADNNATDDMKTEPVASEPERGLTENHADTYVSSGDACVDFLFHVLPQTERDDAHRRLEAAWAEDPATAMRLVMQLRAVRGTGKSDRSSFFHCVTWLYKHHPRTLLQNLWLVPEFGCFKDLLEIVRLALAEEGVPSEEGKKTRRKSSGEGSRGGRGGSRGGRGKKSGGWEEESGGWEEESGGWEEESGGWEEENGSREKEKSGGREKRKSRAELVAEGCLDLDENDVMAWNDMVKRSSWEGSRRDMMAGKGKKEKKEESPEGRVAENRWQMEEESARAAMMCGEGKQEISEEQAEENRRQMEEESARAAVLREKRVAKNRRQMVEESVRAAISRKERLARRAAAVAHAYETSERLRAVHNAMDVDAAAAAGGAGGYVRVAKERLQREVLAPLRRVLELPEVHMSSGRWEHVAYGRVPSVCMKKTRKLFLSHDEARFKEYLEDVKSGAAKIAAGAVLPHEVVKAAMESAEEGNSDDTVGELQWKAMVAGVRSKGSLGNSMAVCDVSGSMAGTPMEVAIALSLLVSEVSSDPWKNHLITFSAEPEIHHVQGETLVERVRSTQGMDWGYNTDFQAVFDLLLSRAQQFQLDPADMVQRLYVFSDMQFDQAGRASGTDWETDHQAIVRKYTAAGYPVPQIVYWNLRGDSEASSTPVLASEDGVALVSGFSKHAAGCVGRQGDYSLDSARGGY